MSCDLAPHRWLGDFRAVYIVTIASDHESTIDGGGTRGRILDAAEQLFAGQGYESASVRTIMRAADAPLGLLSYYFGSKDALLEAVVARRASALTALRLEGLEAIPAAEMSVEALVEAYYGTVTEIVTSRDAGWRAYVRLLNQLSQSDRWAGLVEKYFVPTGQSFIEQLQSCAPGVSQARAKQAWVFGVSAAFFLFAAAGRVGAECRPADNDFQALRRFIAGGLRATLGLPPAPDEAV